MKSLLDDIFANEWAVTCGLAFVLFTLAELGYRAGVRIYTKHDEARRSQISGVQGAVLGLLGLLIGFTFSMAVTRYETRRDLVTQEANAIGTTYLRTGLLPDKHNEPAKQLLRRFVDLRIRLQASSRDPAAFAEGLKRGHDIENELWQHAEAVSREAPGVTTNLFISSLNEMIDTDAARIASARNQIPSGVWFLLVMVAAAGCFTSGYASGAQGRRSGFTSTMLPGLISVVIISVFDLTHGNQGVINVSQQPMLELRESIQPPK